MNSYRNLMNEIMNIIEKNKQLKSNYEALKKEEEERILNLKEELTNIEERIRVNYENIESLNSFRKSKKQLKAIYTFFGIVGGMLGSTISFIASLFATGGDITVINHIINLLIGGATGSALGIISYLHDTAYARKNNDENAVGILQSEIRELEEEKLSKKLALRTSKANVAFYKECINSKQNAIKQNINLYSILERKYLEICKVTDDEIIKNRLYENDSIAQEICRLAREKKD